jgi:hypothetical protein
VIWQRMASPELVFLRGRSTRNQSSTDAPTRRRESWPLARLVTLILGDRGTSMAQMSWYGRKPTAEQDWARLVWTRSCHSE